MRTEATIISERTHDMLIVDSQVHIWGADTPDRPWPGGAQRAQKPYPVTKDMLLAEMDTAGVSGS